MSVDQRSEVTTSRPPESTFGTHKSEEVTGGLETPKLHLGISYKGRDGLRKNLIDLNHPKRMVNKSGLGKNKITNYFSKNESKVASDSLTSTVYKSSCRDNLPSVSVKVIAIVDHPEEDRKVHEGISYVET